MSSDKAYVYLMCKKNYYSNKPEIISTNIEYIAVVPHIVGRIKILFNVSKAIPVGSGYFHVPVS